MLLRMLLLDEKNQIVEQMMFTSIEFPDSIDASQFDASVDESSYTVSNTTDSDAAAQLVFARGDGKQIAGGSAVSSRTIDFNSLPGGYYKVSETYNPMPIGHSPVSHVTISDGMASVSVYVEYVAEKPEGEMADGLSRMGAVNAYGLFKDNAFVTVVGEVPATVVKTIGESVLLVQAQ